MKYTFLIREKQKDGGYALVVSSSKEWRKIINHNRSLPLHKRRFFIRDYIFEGNHIDCLIIEVNQDEYKKWNSENTSRNKKHCSKHNVLILSLDAPIENNDSLLLKESIIDSNCFEDDILCDVLIQDLRENLSKWQPWANEMLDLYLSGKKKESISILSKKYGVSKQTFRKKRHNFENFIKKFIF